MTFENDTIRDGSDTRRGAFGRNSRTYDFPPFHAISVHAGLHAVVKTGPVQSVRVEARDSGTIDQLDLSVINGELTVTRGGNFVDALLSGEIISYLRQFGQKVVVNIVVPELDEASAASGAHVEVDRAAGPLVCLAAASGGHLRVGDVDATRLELDAASGGSLKLSGDCDRAEVDFSSGGSIGGRELTVGDLDVSGSSGGSARLSATGMVTGHVSSGASLKLGGRPREVHVDRDSGGSVSTR